MEQTSIPLFLALKGLSSRTIYNELTAVLSANAVTYSTVTKYLRQR
jgi:Flp pilus assembly protein protease CpaA